jgi:hypothetical protein
MPLRRTAPDHRDPGSRQKWLSIALDGSFLLLASPHFFEPRGEYCYFDTLIAGSFQDQRNAKGSPNIEWRAHLIL